MKAEILQVLADGQRRSCGEIAAMLGGNIPGLIVMLLNLSDSGEIQRWSEADRMEFGLKTE